MPFRVIQPPSDQEQFTAEGKRLFAAAIGLGIPLEPEGFLYSWVNGTRVLVEETAEGEIIGFLLLTVGKRWTHNDSTATVLAVETNGDFNGLIDFAKQIACAFGSTELFLQSKAVQRVGEENRYTVIGYMLG